MKIHACLVAFAALLFGLSSSASAQNPFQNGQEFEDVQNTNGDPSPGKIASRIDDYINQDEQLNLNATDGVIKVLRVNQKNLINDYVSAIVPLANAVPREIRDVMRTVTALEGGRAEVIRDQAGGKAYVQLIAPKFMIPALRETVRELDVEWLAQDNDGSLSVTYYPSYRPPESLLAITNQYGGEGASQIDFNQQNITRRDEPFRTRLFMAACEELDQPPPQAQLKFKIYEVDSSNDLKLGVDWISWKNGPGRSLFEAIFGGQGATDQFKNATGFFDPNLGAMTVFDDGHDSLNVRSSQYLLSANYVLTAAYLDFLRVKGKSRVLASPELYVFNNTEGNWRSNDQFLAFDVQPSDPDAFGIEPFPINQGSDFSVHNRFLNHNLRGGKNVLGMELNVFAVVGTESSEIEVEFTSSDLAGTTPQGTPIITNRRILTKVRLVDGQPFVIGGFTRDEDVKASNKAPWLGNIPVLGYLFGQEISSARHKELVITCVPHFFQGAPLEITDPVALDTIAMARCDTPIEVPRNCFGFDKWIFDTVEHCCNVAAPNEKCERCR